MSYKLGIEACKNGSQSTLIGTGLFIASILLLTLEAATARRIGSSVPIEQLALLRSAGGVILVAMLARREGIRVCRTKLPWLQLLRGSLSVAGLLTYYYASSRLSLVEASAISYSKAFWLAIFSIAILQESVGLLRWIAILVASAGAVVVIDPGHISIGLASLVAVVSAALSAALITLTKLLERSDRPITVMFYVSTISLVAFIGPGLSHWQSMNDNVLWMLAIVVLGPAGQYTGILALKFVDASVIAPFDYARLVLAGTIGYFMFEELPSTGGSIGLVMIASGCLLAANSKKCWPEKRVFSKEPMDTGFVRDR